MKNKGVLYDKSKAFAIKVLNVKNTLCSQYREYNIADQIMRSATSIGANYSEALGAESSQDFAHKMSIALKENYETRFWLDILHEANYINDPTYKDLYTDSEELHRLLSSSIKTIRDKN